ncbi:hypothetical protein IMSAG013_01143 [Clostridiales bacterium]|nr:hypothetical protein IMSAG013_01143 [Clostridiales bacterium]
MIRESRIESGNMFEIDFYPVFSDGRRMPERAPKTKMSCEAQKKLNLKNARKQLNRLISTNFTSRDIVVHGTYRDSEMPSCEAEVRRDIQNYIKRIRRWRRKHGLPEMKYIYVIEAKVSERTGVLRWHFHMIMSGMDRDTAEQMWQHGDFTNADRLQPGKKGCEALAKYMIKAPMGSKRWVPSKNLDKPKVYKCRDGKISESWLARLAQQRTDDRAYWENKYKGYRFVEANAYYNNFNGHWYLSVVMYKDEKEENECSAKRKNRRNCFDGRDSVGSNSRK